MTLSLRSRLWHMGDRLLNGRQYRSLREEADRLCKDWIQPATDRLPSMPRPQDPRFEIQMLCGERDSLMGMWSSFSFCRFFDQAGFVLHSDGTLSEGTLAKWRHLLPGMRVIHPEENEAAMATVEGDYPNVVEWSRRYHFGLKIGGFATAASTPRFLEIDSDVLCLAEPNDLVASLTCDDWRYGWNRHEERSHYAYPERLLLEILGKDLMGPLPPRFNAGLFATLRFEERHWRRLEMVLDRLGQDSRIDPIRYWVHQTLLGILVSKEAGARPLSERYDIYRGPTRSLSIVRHYVGTPGIRPRFFVEGVPALIADACRRGHLTFEFDKGNVRGPNGT